VASGAKSVVPAPNVATAVQTPVHEGAAKRFLQTLTRFDSSKVQPYLAVRNTAGVVLPLIVGYGLGTPRGGLAVAIGALNVSYSDGRDGYAARAKDFPDLREDHQRLLQADDAKTEQYALVNVEADRITNSLNTLRQQVTEWVRPERGG
jgi:hypothetical protein